MMNTHSAQAQLGSTVRKISGGFMFPLHLMEHCDSCRKLYKIRKVTIIGQKILCETCADSRPEFSQERGMDSMGHQTAAARIYSSPPRTGSSLV